MGSPANARAEKELHMRKNKADILEYVDKMSRENISCSKIDTELYEKYSVKRGLRDKSGTGVLAGLTTISTVKSYEETENGRVPCPGELRYRGINVTELVKGCLTEHRFGFEEASFLLLFGHLPTDEELREYGSIIAALRYLPTNFVRDVVMKAPSRDIMNSMTRSVLTLSAYDSDPTQMTQANVLRQCLSLISRFPMLAVYGYQAYNHYVLNDSLYIHRPDAKLSAAENILRLLRPDKKYTALEAQVLDIALILHMEHGGGNNSSFTTHVVASSGSDTFSVMAAALCSLKGPKHGGANIKVVEMVNDLKKHVHDTTDEDEVRAYLEKLLNREAFDQKGLIYGMGHAVYSISDPRAEVFKGFVKKLALEKGREDDFALYSMIDRLAPQVIAERRRIYKGVSPNVDFYSGFVYSMLDIPVELYTPIFAMARIVGWSAHMMEELTNVDKIIRPAYRSVSDTKPYLPLTER